MSVIAIACGLFIGFGVVGELGQFSRAAVSILSVFLAVLGFYHTVRNQKALHIDISGNGRILISEMEEKGCNSEGEMPDQNKVDYKPVQLADGTVLWSFMLILNFCDRSGHVMLVTVLADSTHKKSFKELLVACKWIVSRQNNRQVRLNG